MSGVSGPSTAVRSTTSTRPDSSPAEKPGSRPRTLATAIAVVMLSASFVMLFAINLLQAWMRKRSSKEAR